MRIQRALLLMALLVMTMPVSAQKVTASFKVIKDKLQGRNVDLVENLERRSEDYVNNYDWSKTDDPTPLKLDFQLYIDRITEDGEGKKISATLYSTNGRELQFLDNACIFAMTKGQSFHNDESRIDPYLSILDFYIYIFLADELDGIGKFKGSPFFQKAKSLAAQAKNLVPYNARGWDDRIVEADRFLDPRYQDYRVMKDQYFEGLYRIENGEVVTGQSLLLDAVKSMEKLLNQVTTKNHTERFIQVHYIEICKAFEHAKDKTIFDRLMNLDPKNKDTYLKYKDGSL